MTTSADHIAKRAAKALWGKSLIHRVLERKQKVAERQEKEAHGEPIEDLDNPGPGVTVLVDTDAIDDEANKLISNGLENFEAESAIQCFRKEIDPFKDPRVPTVDGTQTVEESEEDANRFVADLQINVVHPVFSSSDPKYLQAYAERVLKSLSPAELIVGIQSDLKEYVARAFKPGNIKFIGNLLASVAIKWRSRTAPKDLETLHAVLKGVIGHEYSHGLILALPAGDIPVSRKAELEEITFEAYQRLLQEETVLHGSVAMFKNVYKAVRAVRNREPSEVTGDDIVRIMADETFNDRFSMYLDELHRKNKLYREVIGVWKEKDEEWMKKDKGHYGFADYGKVDRAEEARGRGQLGAYLKDLGITMASERLARLESDLQAAERAHFFIARYSDPQLTPRERTFFYSYLRLLRQYDQEGTANRFTRRHVETSDPVKMVQTQLISRAH